MDYIGSMLLIIGLIFIGKKDRRGWLIQILGNILFIFIMFESRIYGALVLSCVMTVLCIINYKKWKKNY